MVQPTFLIFALYSTRHSFYCWMDATFSCRERILVILWHYLVDCFRKSPEWFRTPLSKKSTRDFVYSRPEEDRLKRHLCVEFVYPKMRPSLESSANVRALLFEISRPGNSSNASKWRHHRRPGNFRQDKFRAVLQPENNTFPLHDLETLIEIQSVLQQILLLLHTRMNLIAGWVNLSG